MFLEKVKADFIDQGNEIASRINAEAERSFLAAARSWALNGGVGGEPKPDLAVEAVFSFEGNFALQIVDTNRPVSNFDPKSFLPKYLTDDSAVGGPVGGPIPNQPGRFYAASNASPYLGQIYKIGSRRFVFTGTTPFNKFWEEV